MKKCPNCGAPLQNNTCNYCHYTESEPINVQEIETVEIIDFKNDEKEDRSNKNKGVAFLLCLFLGFFGIHRFYVGKINSGLLYLFTMGLFLFGWIVDLISILNNSFTDSNGLTLKN